MRHFNQDGCRWIPFTKGNFQPFVFVRNLATNFGPKSLQMKQFEGTVITGETLQDQQRKEPPTWLNRSQLLPKPLEKGCVLLPRRDTLPRHCEVEWPRETASDSLEFESALLKLTHGHRALHKVTPLNANRGTPRRYSEVNNLSISIDTDRHDRYKRSKTIWGYKEILWDLYRSFNRKYERCL